MNSLKIITCVTRKFYQYLKKLSGWLGFNKTVTSNGWRFKLYEEFDSLEVQKMLFQQEFDRVVLRYPKANHETHFHETTRLISPVKNLNGTNNIPAHNASDAINVEIIDKHGNLADMGILIKDWNCVAPELCLTDYDQLSEKIKHHRQLLREIMESRGFVDYPTEWWHHSHSDRYLAYHKHTKVAIYGSADDIPIVK